MVERRCRRFVARQNVYFDKKGNKNMKKIGRKNKKTEEKVCVVNFFYE